MKKWIWSEKKKQERTELDFTAKNRRRDLIERTVKVHLELQMEYPGKMNIVEAIRDIKTTFDLPVGIEVKTAHLAHIEIMENPND